MRRVGGPADVALVHVAEPSNPDDEHIVEVVGGSHDFGGDEATRNWDGIDEEPSCFDFHE
jgi:hypothetical protein